MSWSKLASVLTVLVAAGSVTAAQAAITHGTTTINMDFVTVGNAGNTADDTGYGAVGYAYRIGTYEVTAAQWAAVITADPNVGDGGNWVDSQPTAGTSWNEAAKFCNWLTTGDAYNGYYLISGSIVTPNALSHDAYAALYGTTYFIPTENEWYKASYYDPNKGGVGVAGYWDYPTKLDSPGVPDGIDTSGDTFDAVFWDGYHQDRPNDVSNSGVASAYGTMGQGGNLWEWNEALIGSARVLRGGSVWNDSHDLLASTRNWYGPTQESYKLGFRVSSSEAVPEPASVIIWSMIAGIAVLWRWRRHA